MNNGSTPVVVLCVKFAKLNSIFQNSLPVCFLLGMPEEILAWGISQVSSLKIDVGQTLLPLMYTFTDPLTHFHVWAVAGSTAPQAPTRWFLQFHHILY